MSNVAKLAKQAAQLEHDRQYEKALTLYARVFDDAAGADEEVDVALFNRAGDLAMRLGDAVRAVGYYERAIDGYAAGGLLNNAIAVCNKVLRHAPESAATHYTLAVLHAKQGFRGDAKFHYVEYAERMHRAGRDDEALKALGEFAALCPDGDDARAMLARHLAKGNRGTEISARLDAMLAGVAAPAPAPAASAPAASAPAPSAAPADAERGHLVFLDVSLDGDVADAPAVIGLEPTALYEPEPAALAPMADKPMEVEPIDVEPMDIEPMDIEPIDVDLPFVSDDVLALEPTALDAFEVPALESLVDDDEPLAPLALPTPVAPAGPRWTAELPGELPMLSLTGWIGSVSPAVIAESPVTVAELPLIDEDAAPVPAFAPVEDEPTEELVDLGDWLRATEPPPTTRLTVDDATPTGDEAADFARLLGTFKAGVARNVDVDDHASHYDLGVAYREMGLVDEAIASFQRASRAPSGALRAREALGQCFLDRGSPALALATLERALDDAGAADETALVGVVYLLGEAHERLGQRDAARACFERVVATDIEFRDAVRRLTQLSASTP